MNIGKFATCAVASTLISTLPMAVSAGHGERWEIYYDKKGNLVDRRLDIKASRIEKHYDHRADTAFDNGHYHLARQLERKGDLVDHHLDKKGDIINRHLDAKGRIINNRLGN